MCEEASHGDPTEDSRFGEGRNFTEGSPPQRDVQTFTGEGGGAVVGS